MPWNYPYWQIIRFAVPAIAAGNTVLLKQADNTTGCAISIEKLMREAGLPDGVFQRLIIDHDTVARVIAHDSVVAITLTGSERAGSQIGALAGQNLKKAVLELGGNDPYIIFEDADIEKAAKICVASRLVNNGQSCIAAKRFIAHKAVYSKFLDAFVEGMRKQRLGDPMDPAINVGPLAKEPIRNEVDRQVKATVAQGGSLLLGGQVGLHEFLTSSPRLKPGDS